MRTPRRCRPLSRPATRSGQRPRNTVSSGQPRLFAVDAGAALMPAHTSLAKLLAAHILRDGEIVLLVLRPSLWFILLSSFRFVIGGVIAIVIIAYCGNHSIGYHGSARSLMELVVSTLSMRLMWATLQWMSRLYVLTDLRVLSLSGVFNVTIFDCPLRKIARTRLNRTNEERLTGVGSIEIIPQDDSLPFGQWQTIPQPMAVHEQILATISRAKHGG
jgi:hypothetical protein